MVKHSNTATLESWRADADQALRAALDRIPFAKIVGDESFMRMPGALKPQFDRVFHLRIGGKKWDLICEFKQSGQPRQLRDAIWQLKEYVAENSGRSRYGIVVAPFISEDTARTCLDAGVGFVDLAGNCGIQFDHVFIERRGPDNPFREKRSLRSLFTRKAGRVLRLLLTPPIRAWKVTELAAEAGVSLGHVSNVRKRLIDQEWAIADQHGIKIKSPEKIAQAWQSADRQPPLSRKKFYTSLHGERLDSAVSSAIAAADTGELAILASFSAARWLAPYVRQATNYFYADAAGLEVLRRHLHLENVPGGENVVVDEPREDDVFARRIQPAPGVWCTSLVQTWLDLSSAGERGREAADHLLQVRLMPAWKDAACANPT